MTYAFVVVGGIALILGVRGSIRLTSRYRDVSSRLIPRERAILAAFAVVAWIITFAAAFFVAVSARRILGYEPIDWTPVASIVVASAILFIPAWLDHVVERVARVPWR